MLDCDQLGAMATFVNGIDITENGQALDAIRDHKPGNHFLGTAHTLNNFETAFYRSTTTTTATSSGRKTAASTPPNAPTRRWKEQLPAYEPPPIKDAIDEELRDYVARRKSELPDNFA